MSLCRHKEKMKMKAQSNKDLALLEMSAWVFIRSTYWSRREKTCLWGLRTTKVQTRPAHSCSLISPFIIHLLESVISRLATSEISIFQLVSVLEQTGLGLDLWETLKTGFISTRENLSCGLLNNTGADQPAHPHSLISAFVIRFLESLESTICNLATGEISIF